MNAIPSTLRTASPADTGLFEPSSRSADKTRTGWLLDLYEDPLGGVVVWFLDDTGQRLPVRKRPYNINCNFNLLQRKRYNHERANGYCQQNICRSRGDAQNQPGIGPGHLAAYVLCDAGLIRQISRGVYQLAEQDPLGNPDLVSVALRVPKAVICLISALHFYGMTTQIAHKVYIALPQPAEKPRFEYPPLDIVWLSEKVYSAGIIEHPVDGLPVKIYSRKKTIADCFKFRNKVGTEVALEALKEYLHAPDHNLDVLLSYARIDRVEKLISRYLEALV